MSDTNQQPAAGSPSLQPSSEPTPEQIEAAAKLKAEQGAAAEEQTDAEAAAKLKAEQDEREKQKAIDDARQAERDAGHVAGAAPPTVAAAPVGISGAGTKAAEPKLDPATAPNAEIIAAVLKGEVAVLQAARTFAAEVRKSRVMGAAGDKAALALESATFQLGELLSALMTPHA